MNRYHAILLVISLVIMTVGYATPRSPEPYLPLKSECASPREAVQIFLIAVNRGELTLFSQTLEKSMIIPLRVEYVYELDDPHPTVTVYSELKRQIDVPGHPDLEVRSVTSILDRDGSIVETQAHIYSRHDSDR